MVNEKNKTHIHKGVPIAYVSQHGKIKPMAPIADQVRIHEASKKRVKSLVRVTF